jgi:predicted TIM-barrel fold metal-dependent hydrolase
MLLVSVSDVDGREYRVIDVHQHVPADVRRFEVDLVARLEFMDRFGIDQAILSPPVLASGTVSSAESNRRVVEYMALCPDRFPYGLGTIDLRAGEVEVDELQLIQDLGLSGVVWHHMFQGVFLDHPVMNDVLGHCGRLGLPAFVHVIVGSLLESPWRLARLCEMMPHVTFVALDGLSSPHHAAWMIDLAHHCPNLMLDTAVLTSYGNPVERFVEANGSERLLLGTDFECEPKPFSFPYPLYEIVHASLDATQRAQILGDNAHSLFSQS